MLAMLTAKLIECKFYISTKPNKQTKITESAVNNDLSIHIHKRTQKPTKSARF